MSARKRVVCLKYSATSGTFPLPKTKIELLLIDEHYWVMFDLRQGEEVHSSKRRLERAEVQPWLDVLHQLRLPVFMSPPQVCDGDLGWLEIFSEATKLTLVWHSGLPQGASELEGFVHWLQDIALQQGTS